MDEELEEMVEKEDLEVKGGLKEARLKRKRLKEAVKVGCLRFGDRFSLAEG